MNIFTKEMNIFTNSIQELADLASKFPKAPRCEWSPIPPSELRGEPFEHLSTNGGFVSFGMSITLRK